MQIKVTDTRMYKVTDYVQNRAVSVLSKDVPIAEAELVLVISDDYMESGAWVLTPLSCTIIKAKRFKPILISKTEEIEVGDWYLFRKNNTICQVSTDLETIKGLRKIEAVVKILALPEHFSPKHLQAIVDGKMKEGDKVLVECILEAREILSTYWYEIKLNSSNHITLHKKEEKMYTEQEVSEMKYLIEWYAKFICTSSDGGDAWCAVREQPGAQKWVERLRKWFEQNIKQL